MFWELFGGALGRGRVGDGKVRFGRFEGSNIPSSPI